MALLVLDATPVGALVGHVVRQHERPPDVRPTVRLPENVTVVQHAGARHAHELEHVAPVTLIDPEGE